MSDLFLLSIVLQQNYFKIMYLFTKETKTSRCEY